jgi:hypothetical protein
MNENKMFLASGVDLTFATHLAAGSRSECQIHSTRDSSWARRRMHSSQLLRASPNCRLVNHLHRPGVSIDRSAALRAREVKTNSSTSTRSVAPPADARFPGSRAAARCFSLPVRPKQLPAVAHRGSSYTRDRSVCAPLLSDLGPRCRISGPA